MADKTIGGLSAVQESSIADLPAISTLYDDTKIPVEQQGEAMHMTGAQWKTYAQAGVSQYVEEAKTAANTAQQAVSNVQSSVTAAASSASAAEAAKTGAESARTDAEAAKTGAEDARAGAESAQDAIENMTVSASTLETNEPATVLKTIEESVVNLAFGLPKGAQGIQGDTGSSIQSIERTEGTGAEGTFDTYTVTLTDGTIAGTFQVYNGADGNGAGDMVKAVYDSQNRNTDIFKYVDGKAVTVPGSGTVQVPESLGAGPYTFEFSEEGEDTEAVNVSYSNTESGLTAVNAQEAIDELASAMGDVGSILDSINGEVV